MKTEKKERKFIWEIQNVITESNQWKIYKTIGFTGLVTILDLGVDFWKKLAGKIQDKGKKENIK